MKYVMESHEAKNTIKLLALVFISLAGCPLQGERLGLEEVDALPHPVAARQADPSHGWENRPGCLGELLELHSLFPWW